MEERVAFVKAVLLEEEPFSVLCACIEVAHALGYITADPALIDASTRLRGH